jgi:hypothetical protein
MGRKYDYLFVFFTAEVLHGKKHEEECRYNWVGYSSSSTNEFDELLKAEFLTSRLTKNVPFKVIEFCKNLQTV